MPVVCGCTCAFCTLSLLRRAGAEENAGEVQNRASTKGSSGQGLAGPTPQAAPDGQNEAASSPVPEGQQAGPHSLPLTEALCLSEKAPCAGARPELLYHGRGLSLFLFRVPFLFICTCCSNTCRNDTF